jgi:hypothetical protein
MGTPMSRRCAHCRELFKPKRPDALFCSNRCRQASYRRRSEASEAAVVKQRQAEALSIIDQFDRYQSIATVLHSQARVGGRDVGFMATKSGLLAAGAPDTVSELIDAIAPYLRRETIPSEALLQMIWGQPPAGSFVAREAEKQCRSVLARNPSDVAFFSADPDYLEDRNNAVRNRNEHAIFVGRGLKCRCGLSWEADGYFECCGESYDEVAVSSQNLRGFTAQPWRR